MRLIIYIFVISILFYSCQGNEEKVVEGDLYFKLFDMDKYFDTSDSALTGFENNVKEINPDIK